MTILVFDSGLGGLSILREVRAVLPLFDIVYVADDEAFPYGAWDQEKLVPRIVEVVSRAIEEHQPCLTIIACNTASTIAMEPLRAKFDIPFVGTVPAIKPAAQFTRSGHFSVLATKGTVKRQYTKDLISEFAADKHVKLVGSESLAKIAEYHLTGGNVDMDEVRAQIAPCFVEQDGKRTDIVVLACTHFPFLTNQFREVAPWPVDWLNPAEPIARQARRLLKSRLAEQVENHKPDIMHFTSGNPPAKSVRLVAGFGLRVG